MLFHTDSSTSGNLSKRRLWAARALTALVIVPFALSGIAKVLHIPAVVQGLIHAGIPEGAILPLGVLEISCLVVYLIPRTTVLGTFLLTGYLGGATLANIINRSDFIHPLAVGLLVWAGAYLRVAELRTLLPVRRNGQARRREDAGAQASPAGR